MLYNLATQAPGSGSEACKDPDADVAVVALLEWLQAWKVGQYLRVGPGGICVTVGSGAVGRAASANLGYIEHA